MEPKFDQPMTFDESRVPDQPAAAGAEIGSWGYGVQVYRVGKRAQEEEGNPIPAHWHVWFLLWGGDAGCEAVSADTQQLPDWAGKCQVTGHIVSFCLKVLVALLVTGVVKWLVTLIDPESFYWSPWWSLCTDSCLLSLQVDLSGNCLFGALKRSLMVCNNSALGRDTPYFPNCYFQRQVVNYIINHRCLIYHNKYEALMSLYGVEETDPSRDWNPPLSFNNIWDACWRSPSGGMKLSYMQCHACGGSRSPSWILRLFKSIEYNTTGWWIMPMQFSHFPTIILMLLVSSLLAGCLALIVHKLWSQ